MKYSLDGETLVRMGARDHTQAPQGYYRCAGEDEWIAIAVDGDEAWAGLCTVIDDSGLDDARFKNNVGRTRHADEIDAMLSRQIATLDKQDLARRLVAAGCAAAPMLTFPEVILDPHVVARGAFERVEHPEAGVRELPRVPIAADGRVAGTVRHAPLFAQDNDAIYRGLLAMSDERMAELAAAGVIGDAPATQGA